MAATDSQTCHISACPGFAPTTWSTGRSATARRERPGFSHSGRGSSRAAAIRANTSTTPSSITSPGTGFGRSIRSSDRSDYQKPQTVSSRQAETRRIAVTSAAIQFRDRRHVIAPAFRPQRERHPRRRQCRGDGKSGLAVALQQLARGERPTVMDTYRLGAGHVRFFYTRLAWLARRQESLINEMKRRGYAPQYGAPSLAGFPAEWCGDWEPTDDAMALNRARIMERFEK